MKARFAYPLLFLLPSLVVSVIAAVAGGAAVAGLMWLYVYGDDIGPEGWPPAAEMAVAAVAGGMLLATLAALQYAAYAFGKGREGAGGIGRAHVALALAASVLLPVLVLLHQWSIGNFR